MSPCRSRAVWRLMHPALRSGACWAVVWLLAAGGAAARPALEAEPTWFEDKLVWLPGQRTLLVGDSLVTRTPWAADYMGIFGKPVPEIEPIFAALIRGRHYEQIVLWPGTAHFMLGHDVDSYVQGMVAMVRTARRHADAVTIISPMPYDPPQFERHLSHYSPAWRARTQARLTPDTRVPVAVAVTLLRAYLADVPVYDLTEYHLRARARPDVGRYFRDALHPSEFGYELIRRRLAGASAPLLMADPVTHVWMLLRARGRIVRVKWLGRVASFVGWVRPDAAPPAEDPGSPLPGRT